jgi:O-antigen ligase
MILKYISIPELNFSESCKFGWVKINRLSRIDKYMTLFWFLGPFIYLIERDPADLWLSIFSISFLVRCIYKKQWVWTKQPWFLFAFLLWITGIVSSIFSPDPLFSFKEGFIWIRFPLYAAAAQIWIARDRDIRIIMLLSILLGMLIMSLILLLELLIEPKGRLMWPYGDYVPGGYMAKVSLPLFCTLIAVAVNRSNLTSFYYGIISLISIIMTGFTGERTHTILRICCGFLASMLWRPKKTLIVGLVVAELIGLSILIYSNPNRLKSFTTSFYSSLPIIKTEDTNPYWGSWRGGIQQALAKPITGIGPSGTRNTCSNLPPKEPEWLPGKNYCGNHPHNFYIQLFAETGFLGFIFGTSMIVAIIISCYKERMNNSRCPIISTAFVIPFGIFFPLQQFGSFYGQWGNLFIWFAVGYSISQIQNWDKK